MKKILLLAAFLLLLFITSCDKPSDTRTMTTDTESSDLENLEERSSTDIIDDIVDGVKGAFE